MKGIHMAVLIGMSSAVKGRKFNLEHDENFVGRQSQNHIAIDDPSISGRHCSVIREERKYTLVDLGSTNGTRLNGAKINKAPLKPKDILQLGGVELMFDGQDVEIVPVASDTSKIEVTAEPGEVPENFHTASPFGARRDSRKPWVIATIFLVVLVLAALIFFVVRLFSA